MDVIIYHRSCCYFALPPAVSPLERGGSFPVEFLFKLGPRLTGCLMQAILSKRAAGKDLMENNLFT